MNIKCIKCQGMGPKYLLNDDEICKFCTIKIDFNKEIDNLKLNINTSLNNLKYQLADLSDKILIRTNPFMVGNKEGKNIDLTNINLEDLTNKVFELERDIDKDLKEIKCNISLGNQVKNNTNTNVKDGEDCKIGRKEIENWIKVNTGKTTKSSTNNYESGNPFRLANRFDCLPGLEEEDIRETRLIGDDVIKYQCSQFCVRDKKMRKLAYYKKAGVDKIIEEFDKYTYEDNEETNYIIHVGINDLKIDKNIRVPELIAKYETLMKKFKNRGRSVTFSAILPEAGIVNHNKIYNVNSQLRKLCKDNNVRFFTAWENFMKLNHLFTKDGFNLTKVGSARYGRLLNDDLKKFFRCE